VLTEYYYESLVLLAKLFCLPYEVLYEPQLNKREYEIEPLKPNQKKNFENYFKSDIMLYDYFNKSLHYKIEDYGREKFYEEVDKLKVRLNYKQFHNLSYRLFTRNVKKMLSCACGRNRQR
jgi:hypothetical protein